MKPGVISWRRIGEVGGPGTLVVDVRSPEDYARGHYEGAVNIPYEQIERHLSELIRYETLIFYCDFGSHSLMVAKKMARMGIKTYSVLGGYRER